MNADQSNATAICVSRGGYFSALGREGSVEPLMARRASLEPAPTGGAASGVIAFLHRSTSGDWFRAARDLAVFTYICYIRILYRKRQRFSNFFAFCA